MIIYLLSDIEDSKQFEWLVNSNLNKKKLKIKFILINISITKKKLEKFLIEKNSLIKKYYYKNNFSFFKIILNLFFLIIKNKPIIIHCHSRKASIIGIFLSYILGVKQRIYTRHHGNENLKNYFKGYLIDKLISNLSTDIVSISNNTTNLLLNENKKNLSKIYEINHGLDFSNFDKLSVINLENFRNKYKIDKNSFVVGVISRFIDWKGIEFTILAFKKYYENNKNAILVLANANGPYRNVILSYLEDIPKDNYIIIEFETDMISLYSLFDIFIHAPINAYCEAFGQVYIESLALKIPSVFTKSGIGNDFLKHKKNCYIAEYKSQNSILDGILFFNQIGNQQKNEIIENGYKDVFKRFSLNEMLNKLETLYNNE